jgi:glucokinase
VTGLAIDIGASKMAVGLVSEDGEILSQETIPSLVDAGSEALYGSLHEAVSSVLRTSDAPVSWCGVGCAGPIDGDEGTVSPLNIASWRAFPLRDRLAQDFKVKVVIDVDTKALALAEAWRGAAQGIDNFMAMVVSSGIGAGIVVDGHLLDGASGNAGHIGHMLAVPGGRACVCGASGCLEAEVSGLAILAKTGKSSTEAPRELRREVGRVVGVAVANVVTLLDLEVVLVAGSVALGFGDDFFDSAQESLTNHLGMAYTDGVQILPAGLGTSGPLIGAASIARAQGLFGQQ